MLKDIPEDLLEALLDNPYESLVLVDNDGIVRFMSSSNEGVYPVPIRDAVGRHILDVSPQTRLPRVLKTGRAEIGRSMILQRRNRVIARIPLVDKQGRRIGAAGKLMFRSPERLKALYDRIQSLKTRIDYYEDELRNVYSARYSFGSIIGETEPIVKARASAQQAALSDAAVLITGESGTGKELFAHAVHMAGRRHKQSFVRVNCAAIPSDLIESELFGYAAGAFTGARSQGKPGKFELAHNGTIFLDEIGDMPMVLQVKIMRVLQEREVERIGSNKPKPIDFRVISATNQNLKKMVESKSFRLDLYYRLNVFHIHLPALREIRDDIPAIFRHAVDQLSIAGKPEIKSISTEAMEALRNYQWPGNVRELRNVAERAMIVCRNNHIGLDDLPIEKNNASKKNIFPSGAIPRLKNLMEETEKQAIIQALKVAGNNRAKAAEKLGIHRTGLYQKMKKHGIS